MNMSFARERGGKGGAFGEEKEKKVSPYIVYLV